MLAALLLLSLWTRDGRLTQQAEAVLRVLSDARAKGLSPADYLVEGEDFDAALTAAAARYASDVSQGRVDPRSAGADLPRAPLDAEAFVRGLAAADDPAAELARLEPQLAVYRRTLEALRSYRDLAARDAPGRLPQARRSIAPGMEWDGVPRLARLLQLTGDLPAGAAAGSVYTGALVDAVIRFQLRHGLPGTGVIAARTRRALDVPLSQRVLQLELTLERLRWLPRGLESPPIVVNIPEFRLRAGPWTMKVVVGRAFRHRTPIFVGELRQVVFRPPWNVPPAIVRDELLDEFSRDPKRFDALGFEILNPGGAAAEGDVRSPETQALLRSGVLLLRQKPGPRNALGLAKFNIPNRHGVYLHGTPARALFARERRDFSHGCIRVEDPQALAQWVLGWTAEEVGAAMTGKETREVPVERPVPVLIVYGTAVAAEDGQVRFYEDIYGLDGELERAIEGRSPSAG